MLPAKKPKPTTTKRPAATKSPAPVIAKAKKREPAKAKAVSAASKKKPEAAKVENAPLSMKAMAGSARTKRSRPNQKFDPAQKRKQEAPDAQVKSISNETKEVRANSPSIVETAKELIQALGTTGMRLVRIIRDKGLAFINEPHTTEKK